jgi:EF hand
VFDIADKNRDGFLSLSEFISPIMKLNSNDKCIKIRLVFDIYDFDDDNLISKEDIKTIMLHTIPYCKENTNRSQCVFPLQNEPKYPNSYRSIAQSQKDSSEIDRLCTLIFKDKTRINFDEFKRGCEEISSEMFLSVMW